MISDSETPHKNEHKVKYAVTSEFTIAKQIFNVAIMQSGDKGVELHGSWLNTSEEAFSFYDLANHFGLTLPDFCDLDFTLTSANVGYRFSDEMLSLGLVFNGNTSIGISSGITGGVRCYTLKFETKTFLGFSHVPVLGKMLGDNDGIELSEFALNKTSDGKIAASIKIQLSLGSVKKDIAYPGENDETTFSVSKDSPAEQEVKWIDINKSFKVVTVYRLGVLLNEGTIKILVDASFSLSVLTLEFYGLYLSSAMPPKLNKFGFGLSGLTVAFNKAPLAISGGLYKAPDMNLYNGKIFVKFSKFSLEAMGSYGELENGDASFFIYVMITYPLGGPPFFFVTGLAAGFGVNRKFQLPELKDVKSFPFVQAALKTSGSKLGPQSKPSEALNLLSEHLKPSGGDYFVTIGVAFKSFNLINSFALLTVAFGNNLQISLLGISEISLPPNLPEGKEPIAYAKLTIKAVYDNNEGYLKIEAALTDESYIIDKKCKLTGGFALYTWTKGQYKGDFALTLGGMRHPRFVKPAHYPTVNPLGINWKISQCLSAEGYVYFGLTPSCIMAGGGMSILYNSGRISAWFTAKMDFLICWKPFYYDISLYVSIGASYRGILATYRLEISASVHIWGPEFSGTAHITWFIISFNISFGSKAASPPPISYEEFSASFLPDKVPVQTGLRNNSYKTNDMAAVTAKKLISIRICEGIIAEVKDCNIIIADSAELHIETLCEMPSTKVSYNGKITGEYKGALGVAPMGISTYTGIHTVKVYFEDQENDLCDNIICTIIKQSIASALWKSTSPDINDGMINNVPVGAALTTRPLDEPDHKLPLSGSYSFDELEKHESIDKSFCWSLEEYPANKQKQGDTFEKIKKTLPKNTKRDSELLSELSKLFGTLEGADIKEIGLRPEDYFLAKPASCTNGAYLL